MFVAPGLDAVFLVVVADADDLVRVRDHGQKADLVQRGAVGPALRDLSQALERARRDGAAQICRGCARRSRPCARDRA
ncbi:hypothetical protein [Verminephrobacter aporrectodeae]|uniref:hypothetical protein n=1 Tax=Verminephrobacter aporrectodeae TaxID=1110389 RepID=UPI0004954034|nr:hypothetical protein [Verminephrobacter aporrectodeae]